MAGKLIELKEAAKLLNVSPETLTEMRSKGEIFGYRDGTTWKFKEEEIERVTNERASGGSKAGDDFGDLINVTDLDSGDAESILVTDESVGGSHEGTASTIIGKTEGKSSDSDIQLASDSQLQLGGGSGSGKGSGKGASKSGALGSDLTLSLDDASDLKLGGSDVLTGGSSKVGGGSDKAKSGSGPKAGSDVLSLGDDITIDGGTKKGASGSGKGSNVDIGEDDELVLGSGSDLALTPTDSGINLAAPAQSGLSLEQPLELSGSSIDSFELGEDSQAISLEEAPADPDAATQLKADDEFLLSPTDGSGLDDSDSGSQVIALDETGEIDQEANTMLAASLPESPDALLEEEPMGSPLSSGASSPGLAPSHMMLPPAIEAPYSVWNVLSLFSVVVFLSLSGIMMGDMLRQMWSWDKPYDASSSLMNGIIEALGSK